jgi:hypothetical protein
VGELAPAGFTVPNKEQVTNHFGRAHSCLALEMPDRREMKRIFRAKRRKFFGLRLVRMHAGRDRMATVRLDRSGTAGNSREYQDGAEYG